MKKQWFFFIIGLVVLILAAAVGSIDESGSSAKQPSGVQAMDSAMKDLASGK